MKKTLCLLLLLGVMPVYAGTLSLTAENDVFDYSDDAYTHGTSFAYEFDNKRISFRQIMYTPEDISIEEYIENDRPYAGIALLSYGVKNITPKYSTYFEGGIGFLGDESYAGDTQEWVHEALDNKLPKGWDNQVDEGLIGTVKVDVKKRVVDYGPFQLIPSTGAEIGNLWDYARVGLEPRIGLNIRNDDFGDHIIQPLVLSTPTPYIYLYGILEGKVVLYNATLEGLEKEYFVYDYGVGAKMSLFGVFFNASHIWRSKEYDNGEEEGYSSITIGFEWR